MKSTHDQIASELYPVPLIRGERITRLGEKCLGRQRLDSDTGRRLGLENTGWMVVGLPSFERMVSHIQKLNSAAIGGRWIIVPATNRLAELALEQWTCEDSTSVSIESSKTWHDQLVTFCIPEQLGKLSAKLSRAQSAIAGLILLDPQCFVHSGRSFMNGSRRLVHDRPQMVVDFRAACARGEWQLPFVHMTCKPAGAIPTDAVARIFCLNSYHCIDGTTLGCGLPYEYSPEPFSGPRTREFATVAGL